MQPSPSDPPASPDPSRPPQQGSSPHPQYAPQQNPQQAQGYGQAPATYGQQPYGGYQQQPQQAGPPYQGHQPNYAPNYGGQPYVGANNYGPPQPAGYGPPQQQFAGYGAAPTTRPLSNAAKIIGWVAVGLAVVGFIGSMMPWATGPFGVSINGTQDGSDGVITLILFLAAGALGVVRGLGRWSLGAAIVALVAGLLCTLIAIADMADVADTEYASVGSGLVLVLLMGLLMSGIGIAGIIKRT